jgi:hypothetical protein
MYLVYFNKYRNKWDRPTYSRIPKWGDPLAESLGSEHVMVEGRKRDSLPQEPHDRDKPDLNL